MQKEHHFSDQTRSFAASDPKISTSSKQKHCRCKKTLSVMAYVIIFVILLSIIRSKLSCFGICLTKWFYTHTFAWVCLSSPRGEYYLMTRCWVVINAEFHGHQIRDQFRRLYFNKPFDIHFSHCMKICQVSYGA